MSTSVFRIAVFVPLTAGSAPALAAPPTADTSPADSCSITTGSLPPGTTYDYCAITSNDAGTTFGARKPFSTAAIAQTSGTCDATGCSGPRAR
ncbi:MAG: hypothetical protein U1A78_35855 [Polyangia bacterium]